MYVFGPGGLRAQPEEAFAIRLLIFTHFWGNIFAFGIVRCVCVWAKLYNNFFLSVWIFVGLAKLSYLSKFKSNSASFRDAMCL